MRIRCTACSALLNVADQVAGKRIRCPRCKEATVAEPAPVVEERPQAAAVRSKSRDRAPKADDAREDDTPRPRKKKKKRTKNNVPMIVGITVIGCVAACIATTVVALALTKPTPEAPETPEMPEVAVGVPMQPGVVILPPQKNEQWTPPPQAVRGSEPRRPPATSHVAIDVVPSYFKLPEGSEEAWLAQGREELKGMHRTLRDAYDNVGHRDPKWDKIARLALEYAAGMFAKNQERTERTSDVYDPVVRAIAAGCDDPMILYLHARTYGGKDRNLKESEVVARHVKAAEALRDSKYSPFRRAVALRLAAFALWNTKAPEQREPAKKMLADALDAFVASMAEERSDPVIRRQLLAEGRDLVKICALTEADPPAGLKKVNDALAKVPDTEAFRLKLRGGFLTDHAWKQRGNEDASSVTNEGAQLFRDRLEEARGCFERAWQLDSSDVYVPVRMIAVARGLGAQKEEVRKWFDRAMKLDPACFDACEEVLSYLDPRWHGSSAKVLAFGRECGTSKLIGSHIPLLVLRGHMLAVVQLKRNAQSEYLSSDAVWNEIQEACDRNLEAYPDDLYPCAALAVYCRSTPGRGTDYLKRTENSTTPDRRVMMEFLPYTERGLVYRSCPSK